MNYLLDTNVVSEWVKPRPDANVVAWLAERNEDDVFISVCTLAELSFGVGWLPKGKRRDRLDDWLHGDLPIRFDGRIVAIDMPIADAWGNLQARVKRKGRSIGVMDGLIAATAEVYGMTLVTRDTRDLEPTGVSFLNPWIAH